MQNYAGQGQGTSVGSTIGGAQNALGNVQNPFAGTTGQVLPSAYQTESNLYNNPYAGIAQSGAGVASGLGQNAALQSYGTGQGLIPYAGSILQTGFDPQKDLYNRTLAQVTQQQGAANAGAGVGTTPYGAGLQAQNLQNFNIDWQNAQEGRQAQALQSASPTLQTALSFMNQAPSQYATASAIPYSTYQGIGQGQFGDLASLLNITGGAQQQANVPFQDYMALLSGQNQTNQVANQTNQLGWGQLASLGQGLGSLGGWIGGGGIGKLGTGLGIG